MEHLILTISRQCASGGHEIGQTLASRLGISFYDKAVLMELARGKEYDEVRDFYEEQPVNSLLYALAMEMDQEKLGKAPFERIRRLAENGPCVIIGRCAGYIFRGEPNAVRIFIHADREVRVRRVMEYEKISQKNAEKLVDTMDKNREEFYRYYTRSQWNGAENYDLCLDSGKLGMEQTVETILNYLERRGIR